MVPETQVPPQSNGRCSTLRHALESVDFAQRISQTLSGRQRTDSLYTRGLKRSKSRQLVDVEELATEPGICTCFVLRCRFRPRGGTDNHVYEVEDDPTCVSSYMGSRNYLLRNCLLLAAECSFSCVFQSRPYVYVSVSSRGIRHATPHHQLYHFIQQPLSRGEEGVRFCFRPAYVLVRILSVTSRLLRRSGCSLVDDVLPRKLVVLFDILK